MAEQETQTTPEAEGEVTVGDQARSPEQIQAEIEKTRAQLGDTVAELAEKADVKGQAKKKVDEAKQTAQEKASEASEAAKRTLHDAPETARTAADRAIAAARENPAPVAAGAAALLVIVLVLRRRSG